MLVRQNGSVDLQNAVTTTATGPWVKCYGPAQAYQVVANGTAGAFSATVVIEATNHVEFVNGVLTGTPVGTPLGTITVSGTATTAASEGFSTGFAPWAWIRSRVSAISGTGASLDVWMGC